MAFSGYESMCALLRVTGGADHVPPLDELTVFLTDKPDSKGDAFASRIQSVKQESHPFVGKHAIRIGTKIEASNRLSVVNVITFIERHTFVLLMIEQRYVNVRRVLRRVLWVVNVQSGGINCQTFWYQSPTVEVITVKEVDSSYYVCHVHGESFA